MAFSKPLEKIWIENLANSNPAIRVDWDNDRHQRIEIKGRNPLHVIEALKLAELQLKSELYNEKI